MGFKEIFIESILAISPRLSGWNLSVSNLRVTRFGLNGVLQLSKGASTCGFSAMLLNFFVGELSRSDIASPGVAAMLLAVRSLIVVL